MTANDTARDPDSEKRQPIQQLEDVLRRLDPELTDERLQKLVEHFRRRSGFTDN
jgi:hypothetical protein